MGRFGRLWKNKNNERYTNEAKIGYVETDLIYDLETKIVYYSPINKRNSVIAFVSPYISEKGKYCRYNGEKIVEI